MKIYHVFNAVTYHLSLHLIEAIITSSCRDHYFLLIGDDSYKEKYLKMFNEHKHFAFSYYSSWDDFRKNNELERTACVLIHGGLHAWMFYFYSRGFKNINWVCWGSGIFIHKTWKSRLSFFYKYVVYRSLRSIVVLMPPEQQYLQKVFKCKCVKYIPYFRNKLQAVIYPKENFLNHTIDKDNVVVYLGNSAHSTQVYIALLDDLYHLKENIEIHCMIHYGIESHEELLKELEEKGKRMYGAKFYMHYEMFDLKDYYNYMNQCDVYVCGTSTQTGIGAIFACLSLGKKLYLAGRNYDYLTSLGAYVNNCEMISKQNIDEFSQQVTEEQMKNYLLFLERTNVDERIQQWEEYYDEIIVGKL